MSARRQLVPIVSILSAGLGTTDRQSRFRQARGLRGHRAIERLLQRFDEIILVIGLDVEAAVLFGDAHQVIARARPREALVAERDEVDCELVGLRMELFGEVAR